MARLALSCCLLLCLAGCVRPGGACGQLGQRPEPSVAASTEELSAYLARWNNTSEAIASVARLGTPQAKDALLSFAREAGYIGHGEALSETLASFGPAITQDLAQVCRSSGDVRKGYVRLTCARAVAALSRDNDSALEVLIDLADDPYHEVEWVAMTALGLRLESATRILGQKIEEATTASDRERYAKLLKELPSWWRVHRERLQE